MRQKISPTTITTNEQMTYYLITEDDVLKEITKTTKEVNEVLNLPSTTLVRLILNYFHWDKDTLTERFFEDPDKLFQTLNVANPNLSPSLQWNPLSPACFPKHDPMLAVVEQTTDNGNVVCRTCYSATPLNEIYALPCRHQHCLTCWRGYLKSNIINDGCLKPISCPSRCIQVIDDEQILKIISNNKSLCERYQRVLVEAFVETNRLTQWCPGNECATIVKMRNFTSNLAIMIECDICNTTFCFQCLKQWHEPIQCSMLKKWEEKNQDESMTGKWIVANTKECPKCRASIEKNGGCNHMTCRRPGCGHEFCWLCFGDWKAHATQQCNVYRQEEVEKTQSEAREMLVRYMHYFTRYQTHHQSLELESKLLDQVEQRKKEMEAESMSYADRQSIQKAFEVLQKCRRTLKYTYAFAYYLERSNQSEIFEQNQADLERATEIVSEILEHEIDINQDTDAKRKTVLKLMDTTHYCDQRRKVLLQHCKDGYSQHEWRGLDPY
ncbi:unnamed protein product [Rotaria sp. Silwood2]|nr:unnamed protein product [Rotaria sp. Silwood2]CAF3363231.1 unnamed protein product [Rotaria sp. Silwood2]CAF4035355.1 unnamed protein product [Rotaria sp. Silwood2]CAF4473208.1 unnamed protein product [Rotaria sp. Silwood2]